MSYDVQLIPAAVRQLQKLPRRDQQRIRDAIDDLANNPHPHGGKKLAGAKNLWRIRVGVYRILYEIYDVRLIIVVLRIGHRRDIYRTGL
jgi:mRNA interferase RelE/StbE